MLRDRPRTTLGKAEGLGHRVAPLSSPLPPERARPGEGHAAPRGAPVRHFRRSRKIASAPGRVSWDAGFVTLSQSSKHLAERSYCRPTRCPEPPEFGVTSPNRRLPHPAPPSERLRKTPLVEQGGSDIHEIGIKSISPSRFIFWRCPHDHELTDHQDRIFRASSDVLVCQVRTVTMNFEWPRQLGLYSSEIRFVLLSPPLHALFGRLPIFHKNSNIYVAV